MANKRPAEQWYTGDWYRAVDVQKCCAATRGIWRDAIDAMVNEQRVGKISGTRDELCRLLRCTAEEFQRFLDDNKGHKFANITIRKTQSRGDASVTVTLCNEKVTIICRRLYRQQIEREQGKKRVQRYRQKHQTAGNANVTPYSSSSSSSSCNNTVTCINPTLQNCYEAGELLGIEKDYVRQFYEHYQPQGWKWGNGQTITDLRGALQRCKSKGYTFMSSAREKQHLTKAERDAQMDAEIERFKREGRL